MGHYDELITKVDTYPPLLRAAGRRLIRNWIRKQITRSPATAFYSAEFPELNRDRHGGDIIFCGECGLRKPCDPDTDNCNDCTKLIAASQ